jgi:hypothetical protein
MVSWFWVILLPPPHGAPEGSDLNSWSIAGLTGSQSPIACPRTPGTREYGSDRGGRRLPRPAEASVQHRRSSLLARSDSGSRCWLHARAATGAPGARRPARRSKIGTRTAEIGDATGGTEVSRLACRWRSSFGSRRVSLPRRHLSHAPIRAIIQGHPRYVETPLGAGDDTSGPQSTDRSWPLRTSGRGDPKPIIRMHVTRSSFG